MLSNFFAFYSSNTSTLLTFCVGDVLSQSTGSSCATRVFEETLRFALGQSHQFLYPSGGKRTIGIFVKGSSPSYPNDYKWVFSMGREKEQFQNSEAAVRGSPCSCRNSAQIDNEMISAKDSKFSLLQELLGELHEVQEHAHVVRVTGDDHVQGKLGLHVSRRLVLVICQEGQCSARTTKLGTPKL